MNQRITVTDDTRTHRQRAQDEALDRFHWMSSIVLAGPEAYVREQMDAYDARVTAHAERKRAFDEREAEAIDQLRQRLLAD